MQKRNSIAVIFFSFITCGIYTLFWLRDTRRELNDRGAQVPPVWWIIAPVLGLVAVALAQFGIRWMLASTINASDDGTLSSAVPAGTILNVLSVIIGVLAVMAFLPINLYWFYKYSQGIALVTNDKTSLSFVYALYIVLFFLGVAFVWPGIIQDIFNGVGSSAPKPKLRPSRQRH